MAEVAAENDIRRFNPPQNVPSYIYAFLCGTHNAQVVTDVFEEHYAHFVQTFRYTKPKAPKVPVSAEKMATDLNRNFQERKDAVGVEMAASEMLEKMPPEVLQHVVNKKLADESSLVENERRKNKRLVRNTKRKFEKINEYADLITDEDTRKKIKMEVSDGFKVIEVEVTDHNSNSSTCPPPGAPNDIIFPAAADDDDCDNSSTD